MKKYSIIISNLVFLIFHTPTLAEALLFHKPTRYKFELTHYNSYNISSIDANDMNNDGKLDLLVSLPSDFNTENSYDQYSEVIRIMLGTGTGSFQNSKNAAEFFLLPFGYNIAYSTITADINQDENIDFITGFIGFDLGDFASTEPFSLVINNGNARFEAPLDIEIFTENLFMHPLSRLVSADFNHDGNLDLAVVSNTAYPGRINRKEIRVYLGDGNGSFPTVIINPLNSDIRINSDPDRLLSPLIIDLNNDTYQDVVLANTESISILLGDGDGNLHNLPAPIFITAGYISSIVANDLNHDGNADLVIASAGEGISRNEKSINVLLGTDTDSGFFQPSLSFDIDEFARDIIAKDFDGDTNIDLVTANSSGNNISIFIGTGDGHFETPIPYEVGERPNKLIAADFDNDGNHDLAVATKEHIVVMMNSASTLFDSDNDNIPDIFEGTCSLAFDMDSDDDGLADGEEDINANGVIDQSETNPCNPDTDGDGIQDGTEIGITTGIKALTSLNQIKATDLLLFIPDADPASNTDPLNWDSDNDQLADGQEDLNRNGKVDPGETDPLNTTNLVIPPSQNEFLGSNNGGSSGGGTNIIILLGLLALIMKKHICIKSQSFN